MKGNYSVFLIALSVIIVAGCSKRYPITKELNDEQVSALLKRDSAYSDLIRAIDVVRPVFNQDPVLRAEFSNYHYSDLLRLTRFINDSNLSISCEAKSKLYVDSVNSYNLVEVRPYLDSLRKYFQEYNPNKLIEAKFVRIFHSEKKTYNRLTKHSVIVDVEVDIKADSVIYWSGYFTIWEYDRTEDEWKKTYVDPLFTSGGKSRYSIERDDEFFHEQRILKRKATDQIYSTYDPNNDLYNEDLGLTFAVDDIYSMSQFNKKYQARFEAETVLFLNGQEIDVDDIPRTFLDDSGKEWTDDNYLEAGVQVFNSDNEHRFLDLFDKLEYQNECREARIKEYDPLGFRLTKILAERFMDIQ